jgi:hypothetical protein
MSLHVGRHICNKYVVNAYIIHLDAGSVYARA